MERTRREFLRDAAALGVGAWAIAACAKTAGAAASAASASVGRVRPSLDNAGIQLFTVRDGLGPRF